MVSTGDTVMEGREGDIERENIRIGTEGKTRGGK